MSMPAVKSTANAIDVSAYSVPFPPDRARPSPPKPPSISHLPFCIPVPADYFIKYFHGIYSEDDKGITSQVIQYDWNASRTFLISTVQYHNRSDCGRRADGIVHEKTETWLACVYNQSGVQLEQWYEREVRTSKGPAIVYLYRLDLGQGSQGFSDGRFRILFSLSEEALNSIRLPVNGL